MIKRIGCFGAIMSVLLFISGCYDAKEPNEIAYVVALGVDKGEKQGVYEYTIQFAKTTQISGGSSEEGGKEGSNIVDVINVKAPTIYSGINIANQVVSKTFTLAHTKLIVVSEEIAREGVRDIFDTFGRNSDIRPNIYMSVAKGKAKDYLEAVKPVAEVNPVTYYRLIYESEHGGYVAKTILKDFYFHIDSKDIENILPLAAVNEENKKKEESSKEEDGEEKQQSSKEESGEEKQQGSSQEGQEKAAVNESGFDYLMKEYMAGDMDVEKKNASEVMGMAVFKNDKMVGIMDNIESLIYNIIKGKFNISYISFYNKDNKNVPITISTEQARKPKISVNIDEESPKIKIKVFLQGQLMSEAIDSPIEGRDEEIEKEIERATKKEIMGFLNKISREYKSDIIGFGQYAKMKFLTYDKFEEYNWEERFEKAEFVVDVDFEIERVGFIDLGDPNRERE